ncbi:MAG: hypothetical protein AB1486_29470 [Planctomycetota bacterium]
MSKIFGLLVGLALAYPTMAVSQEVAPEKIVFHKRKVMTGDTMTRVNQNEMKMKFTINVGGQSMGEMDQGQTEQSKAISEVLELGPDGVTKIKYQVVELTTSAATPMGPQEEKSPLAGKVFIVTQSEEGLKVTLEDGSEADAETAEKVLEEIGDELYAPRGKAEEMLPDRPIAVGEEIEVPREVAKAFWEQGEEEAGLEVTKMTLTCKGKEAAGNVQCGVFVIDLVMTMSQVEGPTSMKMSMTMQGRALFDLATFYLHTIEASGPMEITGSGNQGGMKFEMKGSGSVKMMTAATFELAKA